LVSAEGSRPWPLGRRFAKQTLADAPRLAQALASAFQDDPVIAWVFPDQQRRRAVLAAFMEFRLRKLAFPHDQVWMTAGGAAAAVWLPPPGRWQLSRPPAAAAAAASGPVFWSADRLGVGWARPHGGAASLRSASLVSVHPGHRAGGAGARVGLGPAGSGAARVDANGMPAYLESSTERNLALYGRHGFEVTSEVAIPGGPKIWPMWREPQR
jgi:hypothetical protein